jgi:hypothetical protein
MLMHNNKLSKSSELKRIDVLYAFHESWEATYEVSF